MHRDWLVSRLSDNQSHSSDINSTNTYRWSEWVFEQHQSTTLSIFLLCNSGCIRISRVDKVWDWNQQQDWWTHQILRIDSSAVIIPIYITSLIMILTWMWLDNCSCVMVDWIDIEVDHPQQQRIDEHSVYQSVYYGQCTPAIDVKWG